MGLSASASICTDDCIVNLGEFTRIFFVFLKDRGQIFDEVFGRFWGGLGRVLEGFWKVFKSICPNISPGNFQDNSGNN